jgi:hypothetical protein
MAANQTLVYGGRGGVATVQGPVVAAQEEPIPSVLLEPELATPQPQPFLLEDAPVAGTLPHLPPFESGQQAPVQLELPPEPQFMGGPSPVPVSDPAADEAAVAEMRAVSNRRTTIAVLVFLAIALVLGLALVWYLFGARLMGKETSDISNQTQDALTSLRRDDQAAQALAVQRLEAVVVAHPKAIEPRAALIIALACQADDASANGARAEKALTETHHEGKPLDRGGVAARQAEANKKREQLQGALAELEGVVKATPALEPRELAVVVRARAFTAAVLGQPDAVALAEELRQKSSQPDSWSELALPEYAANGGSSFDEALGQLERLQQRDTTFLRAYALAARLQLIKRDSSAASTSLETLLTLNPAHDEGKSMLAWVTSHQTKD